MFCLVPSAKSDMVFLSLKTNVSVQTDLSLCSTTCHNHATKGKNMIHIISSKWEHTLGKWKKAWLFFFFWFFYFSPGGRTVNIKQHFLLTQLFFTLQPSFTEYNTCGRLSLNKSQLNCTFALKFYSFWLLSVIYKAMQMETENKVKIYLL